MDFNEIMNFCGYDMEEADKMAKSMNIRIDWIEEAMEEVGLEILRPKSSQ